MLEVIAGLTGNQNAVRNAFISRGAFTSDLASVRADLNDIDPSRAAAALDTLSGEIYAATPALSVETHGRFAEGLRARSSMLRDPYSREQAGGWARAYGRRADVESDRSHAGYETGTAGLAVGADKALGSALRVGVAFGTAEAKVEQDRTRSRAEIRSLEVGGYAAFDSGTAWLDASVSYGAHDLEVSRLLTTGVSAQRRAAGEAEVASWRAEVIVGTRLPYGDVLLTPFAGLAFETAAQDGLRETGAADAGLVIAEGDYQATHAQVGVQLSRMAIVGNGVELTFGGHAGLNGDIAHDDRTADARLIGGGGVFEVRTAQPDGLEVFGGASVSARLAQGWSMYGAYDLAGRSGAKSHALSIGLRLSW
jgi:outer membrane autotransporter protein